MHCNLRPNESRQFFAALITTPCQVWCRRTYPLPYYSVFAADTLLYAVTLTCDSVTLNICSASPVTWWNSVPNLNAIEQSAAELLRFQCLTLWPWTRLIVALGSGIIFTKFDLRQLIRPWIIAFFDADTLSRCDIDLWPVDLESSKYIKRYVIKICTKFERNQIIHGLVINDLVRFRVQF